MTDTADTIHALHNLARALDDLDTFLPPTNTRRAFSDLRTKDQQEAERRLIRIEKEARAINRRLGRKYMGASPAPLRITIVDAIKNAGTILETDAAYVRHRIEQIHNVCPTHRPHQLRPAGWARYIAALLPALATDPATITRVDTNATLVKTHVERAIDGEPTKRLEQPCPYCRRPTLVAYFDRELIRCDRDPHDTCVCGHAICGCHHGKRHEWHRKDGGWDRLAIMLKAAAA